MTDVDHFKRINDKLGHQVGNDALRKLAEVLSDNVRKIDLACRYGGEEFALILPGVRLPQAVHVAERLRASVETAKLVITDEAGVAREVCMTASFGVDEYRIGESLGVNDFLERADRCLLRAKSEGRNRVCHDFDERRKSASDLSRDERRALRL